MIQDITDSTDFNVKYSDILIQPDDILRIKVNSQTPEISQIFNHSEIANSGNMKSYQVNGYRVSSEGFLEMPVLGPLYVKNMSIKQITDLVSNSLREKGLLTNPSVDVKLVNAYFTIIGEVNNPGRYNFLKNNMDLFQAIGTAGDLTIFGERENIKILRNFDNKLNVISVDLTSSQFLKSNNFQIFPGDIIIINPNNARVKNAGLIGNPGNLLSVLSFVLSSIILVTSN